MQNEISPISYGASTAAVVKSQGEQSGVGGVSPSLYSDQLYQSSRRIMQQHQDMVNRHALCLTRLREASLEAESLRLENNKLRSVNRELHKQLSLLVRSSVQSPFDYNATAFQMINELGNLSIGCNGVGETEHQNLASGWDDVTDESPTSVMESVDLKLSSLPKSLSIRSNGYLKVSHGSGAGHGGKSRGTMTKPGTSGQLSSTIAISSLY